MPKLFSSMSKMSSASLTRDRIRPAPATAYGPDARLAQRRADHEAAHERRHVAVGDTEDHAVVLVEQIRRDAAVEFDADDAV